MIKFFGGFRAKITLVLVFSLLFVGGLSEFLIYKYSLDFQFEQLRKELVTIARTSALMIDADLLAQVPLTKQGVKSSSFKTIAEKLLLIKETNPSITYIYTMGKTEKEGVFEFIVDPEPESEGDEETSYPGDKYDASRFPEMVKSFQVPSADKKLEIDEWGVFLSGYAPIHNKDGQAIAILGVDMAADDVHSVQGEVKRRAIMVLALGILVSVIMGALISSKIARPIKKLVRGTRHIASGNLQYEVEVKGNDEIAELGIAFNKMASDLDKHIEELKRTTAEKERLLRELEIARGIQQSFLPDSIPKLVGLDIAAVNLPARMVGGDFYDFIPVAKDKIGLVVADVSGKGIPAALFMALSRTLVRATTIGKLSVLEAIQKANKLIVEDSKTNMFVTLFYAILDSKERKLQYVNAGHNPPIFFRKSGGDITLLEAQGIPMGLLAEMDISVDQISLKKGDVVILYTDGITEATNKEGEQFEIERLSQVLKENSHLSAESIMKKIQEEVNTFVGGQPQFDDITLMVVKSL